MSPEKDFPFYNGRPVALSGWQWAFLMAAVAAGFAALYLRLPTLPERAAGFASAVLFPLIPLLALSAVAGSAWRSLFRWPGARDAAFALGVALLNIAVTIVAGMFVSAVFTVAPNPVFKPLQEAGTAFRVLFFLQTIPQLLGEEILTILPFLALMTLLHGRLGMKRGWAIACAWIASSLIFGAVHLPTYQWNLVQCLVVIGSARIVLTLAYLRSKNIVVSALAHIINDWILLGGALLLLGLAKP